MRPFDQDSWLEYKESIDKENQRRSKNVQCNQFVNFKEPSFVDYMEFCFGLDAEDMEGEK